MNWWWKEKPTHSAVATGATTTSPGLTEAEIDRALAVREELPLWRAVLQLINTAEENANHNAAEDIDHYGTCAGYVGGAEHLRMLKEELERRRVEGLRKLREAASE
jgi:hypothetical protein